MQKTAQGDSLQNIRRWSIAPTLTLVVYQIHA